MPSRDFRRYKQKSKGAAGDAEKTLPGERRKRHPFLYAGSVLLLVIIVVAFVGAPMVRRAGSAGGAIVFGTYGGEEIKYVQGNYLSRQVEILSDQLNNSDSSNLSYQWKAYQVWKGAYDRAVVRIAILQEAAKAGVYVSDNAIDALLLTSGPYMENGAFSESRYNNTAPSERFRYRELYRDELIHQTYIQDMLHNGFFSSGETEFFKNMGSDERSFNYVLFKYEDYPDSEVLAYAQDNADNFRRIKLSRITIQSSRSEAVTVRQQVVDGISTFENQARNYSSDMYAEQSGDMGWQEYYDLAGDFNNISDLDAIFALKKGDISPVYETSSGWMFYRIDEAAVSPDFSNPEELTAVRSYMEQYERGRIEDYLLAQANDFSSEAKNIGFEQAANARGLEMRQSDSFPINYANAGYFGNVKGTDDTGELSGSAYDTGFFTTLFKLKDNELSEPTVLNKSVGVFRLAEKTSLSEEGAQQLLDYYPNLAQQNILKDLNSYIMDSDKFKDNFTAVFSAHFLNQNQ